MRASKFLSLIGIIVIFLYSCSPTVNVDEVVLDRMSEDVLLTAIESGNRAYSIEERENAYFIKFEKTLSFKGRVYNGTLIGEDILKEIVIQKNYIELLFNDNRSGIIERMGVLTVSPAKSVVLRGFVGEFLSYSFTVTESNNGIPLCSVVNTSLDVTAQMNPDMICEVSINGVPSQKETFNILLDNEVTEVSVPITVEPWSIVANNSTVLEESFSPEGEERLVNVTWDIPEDKNYSIVAKSDADWVHFDIKDLNINIRVDENPVMEQRNASIIIEIDGFKVFNWQVSQQAALPPVDDGEGYVRFTDRAFKDACLPLADKDGDGKITLLEAESVEELVLQNKGINNLVGVDSFVNLWKLDVKNNNIQNADMLTNLPKLHYLDLEENPVESFDVQGCQYVFSWCRFDLRGSGFYSDDYGTEGFTGNHKYKPVYKVRYGQVNVSAQCDPERYGAVVGPKEIYESKDLTTDNTVRPLKMHSKGPGYPVILMGVQFIDTDIKDGNYKRLIDVMFNTICKGNPECAPSKYADYLDFFYIEYVSRSRHDSQWEEHWEGNVNEVIQSLKDYYGPQRMEEIGKHILFMAHLAGVREMIYCAEYLRLANKWGGYYGLVTFGSNHPRGYYCETFLNSLECDGEITQIYDMAFDDCFQFLGI